MAVVVTTPHRPFDRLWQPGHPFRPRRSAGRRWCMSLLLIFMSAVIGSYWYLTDPQRIKGMSQTYLSELTGGPVEIGSASLTLFEGLKLSHVTVRVDNGTAPDNVLLLANAIEIQYNPASLLQGRLQATRIIATGARVKMVEDVAGGRWNYQRLTPHKARPTTTTRPGTQTIASLPQIVLRDTTIEYGELHNGLSVPRGAMTIEGRAFPSGDGARYMFEIQSRGLLEGVGPVAGGQLNLKTGAVSATLSRFKFGRDIEAMLPRQVREFWAAHKLQGGLDIPDFNYTPASGNHAASFRLLTQLKHVQLIVNAKELNPPTPIDIPATAPKGLLETVRRDAKLAWKFLNDNRMIPEQPPMVVDDVSGFFRFDENGVGFERVHGSLGGATVVINGKVAGYSADAPVKMRIESTPGQVITLPENPPFLASLPPKVRVVYFMLKPHGGGTLRIDIDRAKAGELPVVTGELNVVDGAFDCVFFPYPVRSAHGTVAFFPDKDQPFERIELRDIVGHGVTGGPNADRELHVSGWVGAMNADVGARIHAWASNLSSEPALFAACPPAVRHALGILRGHEPGTMPEFAGAFDCVVFIPPGKHMRPLVSVDLNFTDGKLKLAAFPYPLEHLHGEVVVRDGSLKLNGLRLSHGNADLELSGGVTWPPEVPDGQDVVATPDIHLVAYNMPVDRDLTDVLPPAARQWLSAIGLTGTIDIDGPVFGAPTAGDPGAVGYDLGVTLHDASAKPNNGQFVISNLSGKMHVHPDKVEFTQLAGKRGVTLLNGTGVVDWSSADPQVEFNAGVKVLPLDDAVRQLLPDAGQKAWAALDPHGTVSLNLFYKGLCPVLDLPSKAGVDDHSKPTTQSTGSGHPTATQSTSTAHTTAPQSTSAAHPTGPHESPRFKLTIKPEQLAITSTALPYRLEHCDGLLTIDPDYIKIDNFSGEHGKARIKVSGKGLTANTDSWDLSVTATDVATTSELKKAIPPVLSKLLSDLKFDGDINLNLKSMRYRGNAEHSDQPDVDFTGNVSTAKGTMDIGMPLTDIKGAITFDTNVRKGIVASFRGDVALESVAIAERPVKDFHAKLELPFNSDLLQIDDMRGQLAGGDIAGSAKLHLPGSGVSTYSMDLLVRNADIREIAKQVAPAGQQINGQVSASFALQGEWADPTTRRGRGDVQISGKEMYQIPLMLGLMEVTNLSLPTARPFNEGTARYLIEGQRVTFEQVQMRSERLVMSGNGWLDFDTKKVRMNFTTENPRMLKLPVIHDLLAGAKQELFQIQVRGTVEKPKVSTASLHTFTTTVDEVLSGSNEEK